MNLTSPKQVKDWCIERGFHPNRTLGQNFLIDYNTLEAIVDASGVTANQRVLEVGSGLGVLTAALLERGVRVVAVEKDHHLAAWLQESLGTHPSLSLIEADMLALDLDALLADGFDAFVSNLPYSVGTRILLEVVAHRAAPPSLTVLVQTEVADRLAAPPGGAIRGLSGVWVQRLYDVECVRNVKASCFWPRPSVGSTLIRLSRHDRFALSDAAAQRFREQTKLAFNHRRKQVASLFRRTLYDGDTDMVSAWFAACDIAPTARAEELSLEQWCALARWAAPGQYDDAAGD